MSQRMHSLLIQCLCEIGLDWGKKSLGRPAAVLSLLGNGTLNNGMRRCIKCAS